MTQTNTRCMGCMEALPEGTLSFCPRCGRRLDAENDPHMLPVGSVLAGRYTVGRALGQGGFGITYLGWDDGAKRAVAIKEYYPGGAAVRQRDGLTVSPVSYQVGTGAFERGRDSFLEEAGRMAQFRNVPGVVTEYDHFTENGTAYIVMEYVKGRTLKEYLGTLPRPMEPEDAIAILEPVTKALEVIHAAGMLHRDVSPDNIMIMTNGMAKLLDFGAARSISVAGELSNTVNVKMGYAPMEQYATHGDQRAWTDEYALAATVYRCVTGRVPESATERSAGVQLTSPRALVAGISPEAERVLLKGMAMRPEERYPTVTALMAALQRSCGGPGAEPAGRREAPPFTAPSQPSFAPPPAPAGRRSGTGGQAKWALVMLAVLVVCAAMLLYMCVYFEAEDHTGSQDYLTNGFIAGGGMVLTLAALGFCLWRGTVPPVMGVLAGVSAAALAAALVRDIRYLGYYDVLALTYPALILPLAVDGILISRCFTSRRGG